MQPRAQLVPGLEPQARVERARARKEEEYQPRALRLQEVRAFLDACLEADRPFFTILFFTGLRRGEIFRMTWDWVDLAHDVLNVKIGKTGADTVPMAEPVKQAFLRLGPKTEGLVFPGRAYDSGTLDPRKPMDNKFKAIRGACKRAGIDPTGVGFHCFRHSFLTLLEGTGAPYGVVRRLARHGRTSSDITARYLNPTEEQLRAALDILAAEVPGTRMVVPLAARR